MILTLDLSQPRKAMINSINDFVFQAKLKGYKSDDLFKAAAIIGAFAAVSNNSAYAAGIKDESKELFRFWKEMKDPTLLFICEVLKYRKVLKFYLNYFYAEIRSD